MLLELRERYVSFPQRDGSRLYGGFEPTQSFQR